MSVIQDSQAPAPPVEAGPRFSKFLWVPGFRHRRIRVWALAAVGVGILLGVQPLWPKLGLLCSFGGSVAGGPTLLVFLAAMMCEYVDSSLGMGFGTTLTPLLLLAGFEPLQIVPAVLLSESLTGISAGLLHHRDGNVDFLRDRRALATTVLLLTLSVAGVVTAVWLAHQISKFWLTAVITAIVLGVGVMILGTRRRQLRFRPMHMLVLGALAAFNKGVSGGGYGPLVTGGQVVSGIPSKHAVAITSLAEGLTCLVGVVAYFVARHRLDWSLALPLTAGAMLSVPLATLTVRKLPEATARAGVGVATCILGGLALAKLLW